MLLRFAFVFGILFSVSSFAEGIKLHCSITHNLEEVSSSTVTLKPQERRLMFAEYETFRFFLGDYSTETENKIELQIYDFADSSRTYTVADLSKTDALELTFWTRNYLLTAHCKKQ